MNKIADLHIKEEILHLFDFTLNAYSKQTLSTLFDEPLSNKEDILSRQEILKAFIANLEALRNYSYAQIDLMEVYDFLSHFSAHEDSGRDLHFQLLISAKKRDQIRGRLIQCIMLFHKIHRYLQNIRLHQFPPHYQKDLRILDQFLKDLKLPEFEHLIREDLFRTKDMVNFHELLSDKVMKSEVTVFWKLFFTFEVFYSISFGIQKYALCFPGFSGQQISLTDFYHPALTHPIKNNLETKKEVILLTGPNMSGKSTFLKAVGLCVYLGHLGLAVPASKAEMPFFDRIFVSINLNDDLVNGYSHFMMELLSLKAVVIEARNNKKCFAIFDELFRGTNIKDALDITETTIRGLTGFRNSNFFISTHLHQLKEMEEVKSQNTDTYYLDCNISNGIPAFNYQLKEGWSDLKVGRILFEKEGLVELLKNNVES